MPKSVFTDANDVLRETLAALRKRQGFTQKELADELGKPQNFVSNIEIGVRRIDVIEFYALVRALGADPVAVFGELAQKLPRKIDI